MANSTNLVRMRCTIRGTRPLLQHSFGPWAIPLTPGEKTGVAGNDPVEWRRTMLVTPEGQLYLPDSYFFGCLRDAAKYTKRGRGTLQTALAATLQIEEPRILLNRYLPSKGDPPMEPTADVYVDICGVKNPATKGRNVRYRLASGPGWECTFTAIFDRSIVSREQFLAVLNDAGKLVGLADGRAMGRGRFEVLKTEELNAEEKTTAADLEGAPKNRLEEGSEQMRPVLAGVNGGDGAHRSRPKRKKGD